MPGGVCPRVLSDGVVARVLCRVYESTSVCLVAEKGVEKVGWPLGVGCYSSILHTSLWTEERKRMPRRGSWRTQGCECVRLLAGCVLDGSGVSWPIHVR